MPTVRKRRRRRSNAPSAPSPPRRRRHPAIRWGAITLVLIVVAIAAGRIVRDRKAAGPSGAPAQAYLDSLGRPMTPPEQMDALTAYQAGEALGRAGFNARALPYFRRAVELKPDLWELQCDYAASLANSTIEVRSLRGRPTQLVRSSVERVADIHVALAHLAEAQRLATSPADHAYVATLRARQLAFWGLGWDAFEAYKLAATTRPDDAGLRNAAAYHVRLLRDPVEPLR